ncbi:MAG: class I SAM-dependent methyltransferase [Paludibacteraceae bacterium]|nr:class I SAM-dependent methyltransferase [Paludibacteraceae bacterium]
MNEQERLLNAYVLAHTEPESELLAQLDHQAHVQLLHPRMVSGHLQGRLLSAISHMIRPHRILELGTYVGYSALCLAEGLAKDGQLVTIDRDDEIEDFARDYIERSPYAECIDFRIGDALQLLPSIDGPFDLVFIDADKREYKQYYDLVIDKVPQGGYILADNTLWDGKVVEPLQRGDRQTQGLLEFNDYVAADARVEKFILPLRDGITIIRKK